MTDTSDKAIEAMAQWLRDHWSDSNPEYKAAAMLTALQAERATQSPDYVRGLEEAARLVETHAYTSGGDGPSMQPNAYAKHDTHHKTISTAIRALIATPSDPVREAAKVLLDLLHMNGGYHADMKQQDVEAIWRSACDRSGFDAVNSFLRALSGDADEGGV